MSEQHKTHYRKVFKSDHLGVADLEDFMEAGQNLIFTISHVRQEIGTKVAGKKINANIAYFQEGIKPLVLNATNSKAMKTLTGSAFIEDWKNIPVQLYIDQTAKLKGEVVGGVRVSPNPVQQQKRVLTPDNTEVWERAKQAYRRDGNFNKVLEHMTITDENLEKLSEEIRTEDAANV